MPKALPPDERCKALAAEYTLARCDELLRECPEGTLRLLRIAEGRPRRLKRKLAAGIAMPATVSGSTISPTKRSK